MTVLSRRRFLAASAASAASAGTSAIAAQAPGEFDVVIIGAGAAGIAAARRLASTRAKIAVAEASGRLGGRCFTDAVTFAWSAPAAPGATTILYDVLRSTTPTDFVTAATCIATASAATSLTEATTPLVGQAFFYLVRADDTCPSGQGSLGTSSGGTARTGRSCP